MKSLFPLFACLLMATGSVAGAGLDTTLIPADQRWVAHLDLSELRSGRIGTWLMAQLEDGQSKTRLDLLTISIGMDIRTDLDDLTLIGIDDRGASAVIWLHGRFDRQRLESLALAADDHRSEDHDGLAIHFWQDRTKNRPGVGCLVREDLLVLGEDPIAVTAAIDAATGRAPRLAEDSLLARMIPQDKAPIIVAAAISVDAWEHRHPGGTWAKEIRGMAFSAAEREGALALHAEVTTTNADTAGKFRDLLQGLLALATLNPKLTKLPAAQEVLRSVAIAADGDKVSGSISCPVDLLTAMVGRAQVEGPDR